MIDIALWPFRTLGSFFAISVAGALGYIIGVIGCVAIPAAYLLLRRVLTAKSAAFALAVVVGTVVGTIPLGLFVGASSGITNSVPTHDFVIARLNACPAAVAALEAPIKRTAVGRGSYKARGGFGTSSWEIEVAGAHDVAHVVYSAEMHGGIWTLTSLAMTVSDKAIDLDECLHEAGATPAPNAAPHSTTAGTAVLDITRAGLVGLWGTFHGRQLMLTRFDPSGAFVIGMFVDDKLAVRVVGTWKLSGTHLVWHYDREHSEAPQSYWDAVGSAHMAAEDDPIVEFSKARIVIKGTTGELTALEPMDPVRLAGMVKQLAR
jgi:hypothetical protein